MSSSSTSRKNSSLRKLFANNVRMARIANGLSQERLAEDAGLDRTFVGSLERGVRNISIDNIELIAAALGIAAHELLDPALAQDRGFDPTVNRAPRSARAYPLARRKSKTKPS
jgi:transcriptional regulator with XRE-family HTH domain